MIIRSLLYVPANNMRFIEKAHTRGADAIILDLEDAVPLAQKDKARDTLSTTVPLAGKKGTPVFVRINNTPNRVLLDAEAACRAGAFGLYIPKVEDFNLLQQLAKNLQPTEATLKRKPMVFVPLIETPTGVLAAAEISQNERVFALSGGSEDLATSMGAKPLPQVLSLPKQLIHLAAKAAGIYSYGLLRTVADYADLDGMRDAAHEARLFGFDGASCIHPSIINVLNTAFSPSSAEIEWAHKVITADRVAEKNGRGAHVIDGNFVDAPIVARAQAILQLTEKLQKKSESQNG